MNVLASECSSGCESGWTSYLEQSFLSGNISHKSSGFCDERGKYKGKEEVVDEEEDLSMVSDASSGPPHLNVDNGYFNDDNHYQYTLPKGATLNKNGGTKRHRKKEHQRQREDHQELPSLLDDTASSPLIKWRKVSSIIPRGSLQHTFREDPHSNTTLDFCILLQLETTYNKVTGGFKEIRERRSSGEMR
ncbi:Peripheral-type benzodiazepine receptor-associated 1 [Gossypium australe]|uniref:Peripheral-type benzodiazepine receptor-associated 1 n=1 Tax=Gossypium australe TaxID=47621 RepID=A0A5B6V1F7_9ROSI|nr:Peripheral-type benzodiazepine receptor-associated 1 [Gossypium australe]